MQCRLYGARHDLFIAAARFSLSTDINIIHFKFKGGLGRLNPPSPSKPSLVSRETVGTEQKDSVTVYAFTWLAKWVPIKDQENRHGEKGGVRSL
jgi:hypothetical protein